ncbi:TPA: hypothetical protein ACF6WF_001952, partial [Klebsiella pneumoniae]
SPKRKHMITGGDLRQSRLDVGYKTFTISPCYDTNHHMSFVVEEVSEFQRSRITPRIVTA